MFYDTHVHFDAIGGTAGAGEILERAAAAGVGRMVAMGGRTAANECAAAIAAAWPRQVVAAVGLDRDQAAELGPAGDAVDAAVRQLDGAIDGYARGGARVVAVGETGLDYVHSAGTAGPQRALFEAQLALARRRGLPVLVHSRDADADTLDALRAHAGAWHGPAGRLGALHCFTAGQALAEALVELGYFISFSGIVTFRNAASLREVARRLPLERLLIETDSPYLAPVPRRGQRNEPALVPLVAACLAEVRGVTVAQIAEATTRNASQLFGG